MPCVSDTAGEPAWLYVHVAAYQMMPVMVMHVMMHAPAMVSVPMHAHVHVVVCVRSPTLDGSLCDVSPVSVVCHPVSVHVSVACHVSVAHAHVSASYAVSTRVVSHVHRQQPWHVDGMTRRWMDSMHPTVRI